MLHFYKFSLSLKSHPSLSGELSLFIFFSYLSSIVGNTVYVHFFFFLIKNSFSLLELLSYCRCY